MKIYSFRISATAVMVTALLAVAALVALGKSSPASENLNLK